MSVTVYTRDNCAACESTKRQLDKHGVAFEEINVEHDRAVAQQLVDEGWRAMPVVKSPVGEWSGAKMDMLRRLWNG